MQRVPIIHALVQHWTGTSNKIISGSWLYQPRLRNILVGLLRANAEVVFLQHISRDLCGHLRSLYKKSSVSDLIQNLFFISRLVVILLSKRFAATSCRTLKIEEFDPGSD